MEGTKDSQVEEDCELQGCYDCGEFMASSLDKPNRRGNIPNTILLARKPQVDGYRDQVGAMVQQL